MPKKDERSFRYQKRSKDSIKERANMRGGNFDSIFKSKYKQWKPKDGKNLIRVLPPSWDDAGHYGLDIFVNYGIGADNQSYLSLSKHGKGQDPLADARREAQAEGDKELAKKLQPNQRILYWVIDRMDEDEGPMLWAAPFTFDKSLSNLCIDEDTKEVIFIDDPEEGSDVRFYKEGQGLKTSYDPSKMKVLKPSSIHEDEGLQEEWLDYVKDNPLPEVLNFYDADHIRAVFDGGSPAPKDSEDDDEDEAPRRKTRAKDAEVEKPSRRRSNDGDEDSETERSTRRNVRDEVDDDEEKPARKQRSRAADEDDDEEETSAPTRRRAPVKSEDDEDTEKPARRSRAAVADDDEEDEAPPSTRRTKKSNDDEEEGSGSLRERLRARRRAA